MITHNDLKLILPQAYPFLMIDRVEEYIAGERLIAIKNITADEWFFQNNDSSVQYFPKTLLIEAAAQAALVLYHISKVKGTNRKPRYMLGRIKAEFFNSVSIGARLKIEALANKMLDTGGFSDIRVFSSSSSISNIRIVYSAK